jgi:hypothetical protein
MTYQVIPDNDKIYQRLGNVNLPKQYKALDEQNPSRGKRFGTEAEAQQALMQISSAIRHYFTVRGIFGSPGFKVL